MRSPTRRAARSSSSGARGFALALALSLAAPAAWAQSDDLPLSDLPVPTTPIPAAKKKPAKPKGHNKPETAPGAAPSDSGGALIAAPATPALPDVPMLNLSTRIGISLVRSPIFDEATSADLESGLRGVAFQAPLSQNPVVLRPALDAAPGDLCGADDDACFLSRAGREGLDTVVVAVAEKSGAGVSLRLRQLSVVGHKNLGEAKGESPSDRLSLKAEAEALACKLLVPTGCTGELQLDVGQAEILYAGRVLPKGNTVPMLLQLPLGLAPLSAREEGKTGPTRLVPVLREKALGIALSVRAGRDGIPKLVTLDELEQPAPDAAVVETSSPGHRSSWTRPTGFAVAGAGAAVLAAGLIEGAHAKSLLNSASAAYASNGGAYRESNLPGLNSGNSAAHTANTLLLVGGIAAAAGLTLALAF